MKSQTYWVYMLLCENNSYYTGFTNNLARRYQSHLKGTASKYTRSFKPLKIAQSWKIDGSLAEAMQIERFIKSLSRSAKDNLIVSPELISENFLSVLISVAQNGE